MPRFAALNRLKADLDALRPLAPDQEQRLMQELRLEWSYHTCAMRGNALTLGEARALLLHGLTAAGKPLRDHLRLAAHHAAVRWLEDSGRDGSPLTEQFILGMHEVLLGSTNETAPPPNGRVPAHPPSQPGQYKTSPNDVLNETGRPVYFSSPDDTPARVAELLAWYRAETAHPTLHPVALAARLCYRFVCIHPFEGGNGRMAGLLLNLVLLRHGYGIAVIKATERGRYLAALAAADAGEPEPWLHFVMECVNASLRRQIRAAQGGPVDEPLELEVKLALLKQQVLGREDAVKTLWDEEVQEEVYEALIRFWLDDLNQQTRSFDELFMTLGYAGSVGAARQPPAVLEEEGEAETFETLFKAAISATHSEIDTVAFSKKWYHFRQRNNGFAVGLRVVFHFRLDHFVVHEAILTNYSATGPETHWEGQALNSVYLPAYDQQRIHEINHQLATRLYGFIAAKVADADAGAG